MYCLELETYMPFTSDTTVIKLWDEHKTTLPNLYNKIQQKHHATPAMSLAIKHSFSCSVLILLDRQTD